MKPHMAHIHNTLLKKQLAAEAGNKKTSYRKYKELVEKARAADFQDEDIIDELEAEAERIQQDSREGDPIFQQGVRNAKASALSSIALIISELKGEEQNGDLHGQ